MHSLRDLFFEMVSVRLCAFLSIGGCCIPDMLPRWQGAPCRRRVSAKLGAMVAAWWQTLWRVHWDAIDGSNLKMLTYIDFYGLARALDTDTKLRKNTLGFIGANVSQIFAYTCNMYVYTIRNTHEQYLHERSPPKVCSCMRPYIQKCALAFHAAIVLRL